MSWAASEAWNLLYLAGTILAFCMAYYSRHEQIQKITAYLMITYPIGMVVHGTEWHAAAYLIIDVTGFVWCARLLLIDPKEPATKWCAILFAAMALAGASGAMGLAALIAYNMLYLSQLAILSTHGKRYGVLSRQQASTRNDPFFRFLTLCR